MKKLLYCLLAVCVGAAIGLTYITKTHSSPPMQTFFSSPLAVANNPLHVAVAATPKQMQQGLSDIRSMGENEGMLFIYGNTGIPTFWMKDMWFDLDFIWIKNGVVAAITKNAPAPAVDNNGKKINSNLTLYSPPSAIDQVLEVRSGWAERHGIKVGDAVERK